LREIISFTIKQRKTKNRNKNHSPHKINRNRK